MGNGYGVQVGMTGRILSYIGYNLVPDTGELSSSGPRVYSRSEMRKFHESIGK